jgi:hypothetical protein
LFTVLLAGELEGLKDPQLVLTGKVTIGKLKKRLSVRTNV